MVLQSNIIGAFKGGFIAFLSGGIAVVGMLLLTPLLSKYAKIKK
jgi:hypothetical protein